MPTPDQQRATLGSSLFASTSQFVRPELTVPELKIGKVVPLPDTRLTRIAQLLEDALAATTDTELVPLLHEALDEARKDA